MQFVRWNQVILSLIFVFMISFFSASTNAQTTHALVILMDSDVNISESVIRDGETVQKSLGVLQSENISQLNMTIMRSSERKVTTSDMIEWIGNIDPSDNDVVMVYYSGHGFIDDQNKHFVTFEEG
ncbi:MAG: hypothetical protein AAB116_25805, partial [Candidatus Poribacteria bacterium]